MKNSDLQAMLKTFPDDMEVVVRVGHNHGAESVCRVMVWNSIDQAKQERRVHTCSHILPDMPDNKFYGDTKVIVVC